MWLELRGIHTSALVPIGPSFYPRVLLALLFALSLGLVAANTIRRAKRSSGDVAVGVGTPQEPRPAGEHTGTVTVSHAPVAVGHRAAWICFAVVLLYALLLPRIGY